VISKRRNQGSNSAGADGIHLMHTQRGGRNTLLLRTCNLKASIKDATKVYRCTIQKRTSDSDDGPGRPGDCRATVLRYRDSYLSLCHGECQ
jgi:hypothetical protein